MTAITLPLKRFPGQTINREIYFGGLKTAQPLVLTISILFALYALMTSSSPMWIRGLSAMPLICALVSYLNYIAKAYGSGETLLEAPLKELRQLFDAERAYFRRVSILGIATAIVSLGVEAGRLYSRGDVSSVSVSVVSVLAFQMYIGSVDKGLFHTEDILKYCGLTAFLEASALFLTQMGCMIALLIPILSMAHLVTINRALKGVSLGSFLQKTVS